VVRGFAVGRPHNELLMAEANDTSSGLVSEQKQQRSDPR
jgi:hypothetical protein